MTYLNLYSLGAAVAITLGGLLLVVPPAYAGASELEVTVIAPSDLISREDQLCRSHLRRRPAEPERAC